jgi:hypothetical protein
MSTQKAMKLTDRYNGKMECKTCGSTHYASIKSGGGYHRGAWQYPDPSCISTIKA